MNAQKIATLPFRLAGDTVNLAGRLARRALHLAGGPDRPAPEGPPPARPAARQPATPSPARPAAPGSADPSPAAAAPAASAPVMSPSPAPDPETAPRTPLTREQADARPPEQPDVLVAEVAEAGAEDGAGAALQIGEPWPNYGQINADAVIARVSAADAAEAALVELYEQTHKSRRTVLEAAARRLQELAP